MKRRCFLAALLYMAVAAVYGKPVELQAGKTDVKVEFYTPSIVHIVKSPTGHQYTKQSLSAPRVRPCSVKKEPVPLSHVRRGQMLVPIV